MPTPSLLTAPIQVETPSPGLCLPTPTASLVTWGRGREQAGGRKWETQGRVNSQGRGHPAQRLQSGQRGPGWARVSGALEIPRFCVHNFGAL